MAYRDPSAQKPVGGTGMLCSRCFICQLIVSFVVLVNKFTELSQNGLMTFIHSSMILHINIFNSEEHHQQCVS